MLDLLQGLCFIEISKQAGNVEDNDGKKDIERRSFVLRSVVAVYMMKVEILCDGGEYVY